MGEQHRFGRAVIPSEGRDFLCQAVESSPAGFAGGKDRFFQLEHPFFVFGEAFPQAVGVSDQIHAGEGQFLCTAGPDGEPCMPGKGHPTPQVTTKIK